MNEWKKYKLGEVIELVGGGTPRTSIPEYWDGEIPWLSVVDFNTGKKFVYETERNITQVGLENSSTKILNAGDVIISARGTIGAIAVLGRDMAFNQSCYGIKNIPDLTNKDFIYYLIKDSVEGFLQISHGGVFDTITRETFSAIDIILPPKDEQEAIASILSSLDDKIYLLHRQNKTLEMMMETFFRQWFEEYEHDDWEKKSLDKIANYLNGLPCQKYPPKNDFDKFPVLKIKELQNGFSENSDWASTDVPQEYIIENGDILFSWSGTLVVKIWEGEKCILNQHLFKVSSEKYPKWFYYLWIKHHLKEFIAIAESKSTTMGHIKREDLSKSLVSIPPKDELIKMDKIITPIFEKMMLNNKQLITLNELRDILLPKLINGEMRVKLK